MKSRVLHFLTLTTLTILITGVLGYMTFFETLAFSTVFALVSQTVAGNKVSPRGVLKTVVMLILSLTTVVFVMGMFVFGHTFISVLEQLIDWVSKLDISNVITFLANASVFSIVANNSFYPNDTISTKEELVNGDYVLKNKRLAVQDEVIEIVEDLPQRVEISDKHLQTS